MGLREIVSEIGDDTGINIYSVTSLVINMHFPKRIEQGDAGASEAN